jgi:hypothetical protein
MHYMKPEVTHWKHIVHGCKYCRVLYIRVLSAHYSQTEQVGANLGCGEWPCQTPKRQLQGCGMTMLVRAQFYLEQLASSASQPGPETSPGIPSLQQVRQGEAAQRTIQSLLFYR